MATGETTVGGIVGFLRLDDDQFNRTIDRALARLQLLDSRHVDVDVDVDTHGADRDLDRVDQAMNRVTRSTDNMGRSFRRVRGFHDPRVIIAAIGAAFTLVGPTAGAATAAVVGFTGALGVGALAWKGLKDEIAKGTGLGRAVQQETSDVKRSLTELSDVAADALGPGLLSGLRKIDDFLPTLDGNVTTLGKSLGNALDVGADAVIDGLRVMMPLLEDGGRYAELLALKLRDFANSQDFKDFIAYARAELPQVLQELGSITRGLIDLAVALEPVGDALLRFLGLVGDVMSITSKAASSGKDIWKWTSGLGLVSEGYRLIHGDAKGAAEEVAKYAETTQTSLAAVDAETRAQSGLAGALGGTLTAVQAGEAAQRQHAAQLAAATVQMQLQNDAAGILKQSLDLLNGEAITAASAQNSFDSSLANMGTHVDKTGRKIHFTTTSINNMSAASVALRGQLIGQVQNAQRVIEANGGLADSTGKARKEAVKLRQQIIDNAVAHGVDRKAAEEYVNQLFKIPKKVPPTKLDVDKKTADTKLTALEAHLTAVTTPRTAVITVEENYRITGQSPYERSAPGIGVRTLPGKGVRKAGGGTVGGNGGPTADDQLAWLSTGEEVINARSAAKWRPLLKALNADKFAAGGTVGMATGGTVTSRIAAQYQKAIRLPDSGGVQKASDAITRLLAAWQKSIDDADAAARRLELVRAVAKAGRKDVAAAKKELADFDRDQARERVKDSAARKQELLASRAQTLANRQSWAFDHMSTADQLKNITKRLNAEKAYTDAWMDLARQREDIISSQASRLNDLLDQRTGILGQLTDAEQRRDQAIADANAQLAEQTKQLKDTRREALVTWAALDQQATVGFAPSMSFLVANAKDQVQQFTEWMSQLALARSRGLSEDAIALLGLDQGPQALAQLRQVNKGTADQFDQLNALVSQRTQLAQQQTNLEATKRLGQLGKDLLAAQQQAAQAIAQAQADFLATQADLTEQLAQLGQEQGRSYTDAIAEGLRSGIPGIQAAARDVAAALDALQAQQASIAAAAAKTTGKKTKKAAGGWVFGPGTATSDSIPAWLSTGEFVVNAADARRNAGLLSAVNSGATIAPAPGPVNVAAPVVHVYIDGQEVVGRAVRVELGKAQRDAQMAARRTVSV